MYEELFARLAAANVRYVVVGGVAVVLHGFARLTADVDLVIDLDEENTRRALETLTGLGLRPLLPVNALDFANAETRRDWSENRNLKVFSLLHPRNPLLTVDLFVRDPIPFDELWLRADSVSVGNVSVRIASIRDLIRMKREAGRAQDQQDIEKLEAIEREKRR